MNKLTKIFEITQDMPSTKEILPNVEMIYTSAACDACDKYHVWSLWVSWWKWKMPSKMDVTLWDAHWVNMVLDGLDGIGRPGLVLFTACSTGDLSSFCFTHTKYSQQFH